jgi:hypothetical protein
MGAYSNPQEIEGQFDQTQYSRNLQGAMANITNAFASATSNIAAAKVAKINAIKKENAETKEKNEGIELKVAEEQSALSRAIYGAKSDKEDSGMDYATMYLPLIDKYGVLRKSVLSGTSKDPIADRKEADDIYATVAKLKEGAADTYALVEKLKDAYGKVGAGGIDLINTNPDALRAMNILAGRLPGKKKSVLINGDIHNPGFEFTYKKKNEAGVEEDFTEPMSLSDLRKALDNGSTAGIVVRPDLAPNWKAVKDANPNIFVKGKDGEYSNLVNKDYLNQDKVRKETTKELVSGKYEANIAEVDKARLFKDQNLRAILDAQATAIWLGGNLGAQSIYFNDMMEENLPKDTLSDGTPNPAYLKYKELDPSLQYYTKIPISKEDSTLTEKTPGFQEFKDNYARLFINTQILQEQRDGAEDFTPSPKRTNGKGKSNPNKPTSNKETKDDKIKKIEAAYEKMARKGNWTPIKYQQELDKALRTANLK